MNSILVIFSIMMTIGTYLIAIDRMHLPYKRTLRAIAAIDRQQKKKTRNFKLFIDELSLQLGRSIRLGDYKKRKLAATLRSADIRISPETYIARAWVKAGLALCFILPTLLVLPIFFPVILLLSIAIYFKEINSAQEAVRAKKESIESELTRFVATLTQELKASRNIVTILDSYKQHAGQNFRHELEITVADMKSGSYESALTRLEARIGSPKLSDVVRGLIGVLRGDDGIVYFQMLAHDLKLLELQRLKTLAMKRPGKIRKYSFAMLIGFMLMYLSVLLVEVVTTMATLF